MTSRATTLQQVPAQRVLGVDVGGTFTDFLLLDPATSALAVAKVPTTPRDQAEGFLQQGALHPVHDEAVGPQLTALPLARHRVHHLAM